MTFKQLGGKNQFKNKEEKKYSKYKTKNDRNECKHISNHRQVKFLFQIEEKIQLYAYIKRYI